MDWEARIREIAAATGSILERERFAQLLEADWLRGLDESPEGATFGGYEGYDARLSDLSADGHERRRRQASLVAQTAAGIDASALDEDDRLNLILFRQQAEIRDEGYRFPNERFAITPLSGPHTLLPRLLQMTRNADDVLARLEASGTWIEQQTELLAEGVRTGITLPRIVAEQLAPTLDAQVVDRPEDSPVFTNLSHLPEAARATATRLLAERTLPAFRGLATFFRDAYIPGARTTIGLSELPDGDEWYAFETRRFTTTTLSPKEIHEIGLGEVERIRAEMETVMRETGHTGSFDAFFEHLRTEPRFYLDSAEALLAAYREICKRADPKLAGLFGVLPRTPYGVEAVPAHEAERAPTAYYLRGALHAGRPGVFFANTYDLASRPTWEMEALTLHEAVPGHHLQISIGQELGDVPEFRKHARFTAFVEGWGLYAESLGGEMGFYTDPYSRFGQLTYEMWRAIRLVVDTGMHAFGWSREQAIELFRTNAGKADHDIVVEVDRYIAWPAQALAYKLGELTFKRLRARATERLGDRFDVRAFHDELLCRAALPLDVLELLIDDWIAARAAA